MATSKKIKKFRRAKKFTLPLSVVLGFAPGMSSVWNHRNSFGEAAAEASRVFLGYNPTNNYGYTDSIGFHWYLAKAGMLPVIVGLLVHSIIGKRLGVNRLLGQTGIPVVRI